MPLIQLLVLLVINQMKEDIFVHTNQYRYGHLLKLVFSQNLLKDCPNAISIVIEILEYFESKTLKQMMQAIIDSAV